jgi:hypothetical protein
MAKEIDFTEQAKNEHDRLFKELTEHEAQVSDLKKKLAPLKSYLITAGVLSKEANKGRPKKEAPATE